MQAGIELQYWKDRCLELEDQVYYYKSLAERLSRDFQGVVNHEERKELLNF